MALMKEAARKDIFEIRFHARAGQGAKTAAQVLAEAALLEGMYIQAFPQYGPERRGAPVATFIRIGKKPIHTHSGIDNPDAVVVIESNLVGRVDVTEGITKNEPVVINSSRAPAKLRKIFGTKGKVFALDADGISRFILGREIPNLVMVGALVRVVGESWVSLGPLEKVVREKFTERWGKVLAEKNIVAMRTGFNEVGV